MSTAICKWGLFLLSICITIPDVSAQRTAIQNLLADVQPDSLAWYVQQLSGEQPIFVHGVTDTIRSRHYAYPGNETAFQFMKAKLIHYGYLVDSMPFSSLGKNLLATKPGSQYPKRYVLLGAHYDSYPPAALSPGADDNASGTAAVLEAARVFSNYDFPYTIVFALWDEEEIGLIGSNAYVRTIGNNNDTLLGYVNLDMIGWDGNNDAVAEIHVRPVAQSTALSERAQQCNTDYHIGLTLQIINPAGNASDFAPFWNSNYTAIGINEEYDDDFNPYWHSAADTFGHFNRDYFLKCAKLAFATIADVASDTSQVVSVPEFVYQSNDILVYPNPFTTRFHVQARHAGIAIRKIAILDIGGRLIYKEHLSPELPGIEPPPLSPGIYFIRIDTGNTSYIQKVIRR